MLTKFDENVMYDYVIVSDLTMDLPHDFKGSSEILRLPMEVVIEDKSYNGNDIDVSDFYSKVRNKAPVFTAQINPSEFEEYFGNYFKQGKDVIYLCLSSKLSGMYDSACLVAKDLMSKYPGRKLEVIDSLSASLGIGYLAQQALKMRNQGVGVEETAKRINEIKYKLCHWFVVDDLYHLKRGGRISTSAALIGSMMNIKPILWINKEGTLSIRETVRGRKKAVGTLISKLQECSKVKDMQNETVYIAHADCEDDAKFLAEEINKILKVKNIVIHSITPVIGAHTGAGTLALIFHGV